MGVVEVAGVVLFTVGVVIVEFMVVELVVGAILISLTSPALFPNTPTPNKIPKTKPVNPINPKSPQQKQEGEKIPLFSGTDGLESVLATTGCGGGC